MALLAGIALSRKSRVLLSLLGVVTLIAPPLALVSKGMDPLLVASVLALSWLAFYAVLPVLVERLVSRAARVFWSLEVNEASGTGSPGEDDVDKLLDEAVGALEELNDKILKILDDEIENEDNMDIGDASLLAWGLASSLAGEIAGGKLKVYVAVHDDGLIYHVYPDDYGEEVYQAAEEDYDEDVAVARAGDGSLLVILSEESLSLLYKMASRADGERLIVETEDEAKLLYKITREIARAYLRGAPQAYVDYVAYKAIVKMALKGQAEIPQALLDNMLDVDTDTRYKIKRQVDEELQYYNMSRSAKS